MEIHLKKDLNSVLTSRPFQMPIVSKNKVSYLQSKKLNRLFLLQDLQKKRVIRYTKFSRFNFGRINEIELY